MDYAMARNSLILMNIQMKHKTLLPYSFLILLLAVTHACATMQQGINDIDQYIIKKIEGASSNMDMGQLQGKWKITALYKGDFEQFKKLSRFGQQPENLYRKSCSNNEDELFVFNIPKGTYQRVNCGIVSNPVSWTATIGQSNIRLTSASGESITIVRQTGIELMIEGNFIFDISQPVTGLYLLEKVGNETL